MLCWYFEISHLRLFDFCCNRSLLWTLDCLERQRFYFFTITALKNIMITNKVCNPASKNGINILPLKNSLPAFLRLNFRAFSEQQQLQQPRPTFKTKQVFCRCVWNFEKCSKYHQNHAKIQRLCKSFLAYFILIG